MRRNLLFGAISREWLSSGQAFMKDASQRVDVGGGIRLSSGEPLWRHVMPSAQRTSGAGQPAFAYRVGNTEVDQVGKVELCKQDVRRLDVPMDESDLVRGFHGHCDLLDDVDSTARGYRTALKNCLQIASFDQAHVDKETPVDFTVVVNGNDVRLVQTRSGMRLTAKPLLKHVVGGIVRE